MGCENSIWKCMLNSEILDNKVGPDLTIANWLNHPLCNSCHSRLWAWSKKKKVECGVRGWGFSSMPLNMVQMPNSYKT